MIPYSQRAKQIPFVSTFPTPGDWYSYLINAWIPSQPDHFELIGLFIDSGFDPKAFIKTVTAVKTEAKDPTP